MKDWFLMKCLTISPPINSFLKPVWFSTRWFLNQSTFINYPWNFYIFDNRLEVRSVFLNTFKAFDKVRHERFVFKLKQNRIAGELLHILSDFLREGLCLMVKLRVDQSWCWNSTWIYSKSIIILNLYKWFIR